MTADDALMDDDQSVCKETNKDHICTRPVGHHGFHLAKTDHGSFSWNHTISTVGRWKEA